MITDDELRAIIGTSEIPIQKQIIDYLELQGYLVFRMNAGKGRHNIQPAPPGTPDLLCIMDNSMSVWIEVKLPGKEPTKVQNDMHYKLTTAGHNVIVVHSLDELKRNLPDKEINR